VKSEIYLETLKAYRSLFWPQFIDHDGCVFLAFEKSIYQDVLTRAGGNRREVEKFMNHRHIVDLLPKSVKAPTTELVLSFGELLKEMWEAKLHRDFPEQRFIVSFVRDSCEELSDFEISFCKA
jgi:hypothetical protein